MNISVYELQEQDYEKKPSRMNLIFFSYDCINII